MTKRNENRPGYKKTRVGWIPEEWEVKPLGVFGSFSKGKGISNSEKRDRGIPCITYGEIYTKHDFVIRDFCSFISIETANASQRIKKNSILFAGSGETLDEIGKSVAYIKDIEAYAGGDIIIFNFKSVNALYLSYSLNSDLLTIHRRKLGQGYSVVHIYAGALKTLYVPIPPLPEQKKIAEILSAWDRAIEQVGRLIDAKTRLKKGLIQQLLTGRMRFQEFGKPVQEKGELPKGWRKVRLRDVASIKMGTSPSSTSYNNNGYGLPLIQGNADIINRKTAPSRWTTEVTTECFVGDLVMTVRAPIGEIAVSEHHACVGRGICVITPRCGTDKKFLFQLLISMEQKWTNFGQGSTFTCVTGRDIRNYKFIIPSSSEQTRIAAVLSACDREIELLKKKQEQLKTQKRGLMQKLLTGEVRHPEILKERYS